MAEAYKNLGQSAPSATTLTDLYTVPSSTSAVVSTVTVCNRSSTATTFRVSVAPAGAADTNAHYLWYDVNLPGNDTFAATIGLTLATTDKIRVYAGAATLSFHAYGSEIT